MSMLLCCGLRKYPRKKTTFRLFFDFLEFYIFLHIYFVANNLVRTVVGNLQLGITESPVRLGALKLSNNKTDTKQQNVKTLMTATWLTYFR